MSRCSYEIYNLNRFITRLSPVVNEILSVDEPKFINLYQYSLDMVRYLESSIGSNTYYPRHDKEEFYLITSFLNYSLREIAKDDRAKRDVSLVLSHGDLWEGNILVKGKQTCVIDWNTIGQRSFYYDFYFSIFMLASKMENFDKVDNKSLTLLNNELDASVVLFSNLLERNNYNNLYVPRHFELYRYLFYIELITLKLQVTHHGQIENSKEIITWIKRFEVIENLRTK